MFLTYFKYLLLFYFCILSFQFVEELDWFTVPVVGIISYTLQCISQHVQKAKLADSPDAKIWRADRYLSDTNCGSG